MNVPQFDEISAKSVFPLFKNDPEIMKYIPDLLAAGKLPDRVYFYNILNTVHPEYMSNAIKHANEQRYGSGQINNQMEEIKVSDSWWAELNEMPFVSRKYYPFNFISESEM